MAGFANPRGDLSPSGFSMKFKLPATNFSPTQRKSGPLLVKERQPKSKTQPCYDWIFSSATNVHVAVDQSSFRTYTPFDTFVLTVADQKRIIVKGVGQVDLKIRCKPGSRESRIVTLENVLHIPDWFCNIFSDVYFRPASDYSHEWSHANLLFKKKQNEKTIAWGHTESFWGLERLVLARILHGRSPMSEDNDREIWSINLHWPANQKEMWEHSKAYQLKKETMEFENNMLLRSRSRGEAEPNLRRNSVEQEWQTNENRTYHSSPLRTAMRKTRSQTLVEQLRTASSSNVNLPADRARLTEIDKNMPLRPEPLSRACSLRSKASSSGLLRSLIGSPGRKCMNS